MRKILFFCFICLSMEICKCSTSQPVNKEDVRNVMHQNMLAASKVSETLETIQEVQEELELDNIINNYVHTQPVQSQHLTFAEKLRKKIKNVCSCCK